MSARVEQTAQLVYRGVWKVLAEWFKVPQEPPTLPTRPGEHLERFKPSPGLLRYLKLFFWIGLCIVDLILLALWIASFAASPVVGAGLTPVILIGVVLPEVVAYLAIHLRYDSTWYVLSDRSVRIRRGIWTITETTITFENVQDVKVEQGPVQRYFGISDIVIQTAGGGGGAGAHGSTGTQMHVGRLEGVEDAQRIRDLIMNRVRQSRSAGLGDEHHHPAATPKAHTAMWTPAHVDLLREIRDGLRSLHSASGNVG